MQTFDVDIEIMGKNMRQRVDAAERYFADEIYKYNFMIWTIHMLILISRKLSFKSPSVHVMDSHRSDSSFPESLIHELKHKP